MPRGLSVELVVEAAIEIADESGLAAVTMAAVAQLCPSALTSEFS